jgi:trigger factor
MDYKASEAGTPVPEATENDAIIEIGTGALHPEFEKNILGMKTGESKTFTVKFPMPEKEEERLPVSGRTLDFDVSMKDIRQKKRPELTDELAAQVGPFKNVEELKSRVEQDLKNQKETQQKRDLQEQVLTWLIENNPVETPETLVNRQMEQLAVDAGMQLSQMGLDEKAIEERLKGWGDQMHERATRQIKASLLLGAIAKKENIQAADEDIRQEIARIAVQSNRSPKDVLEDLQKRGLIGGLIKQVTEIKALDWVLEKAI